MKGATIGGCSLATLLALVVLIAGNRALDRNVRSAEIAPHNKTSPTAASEVDKGFLYGRITTHIGATYEGRLRWGVDEEALWGHYFNGWKDENPWIAHVPPEMTNERHLVKIFGIQIAQRERPIDFGRPFMARFGDIARIEGRGTDVRVTLKSGTVFDLDRFSADDFADGVRVWDAKNPVAENRVVDLDERQVLAITFLPTTQRSTAPGPLYGSVRTPQGEFTGFVQWNRKACLGTDELWGHAAQGEVSLRFDAIRAIERRSADSSLVTLLDGSEIVLAKTSEVGQGNRGLYVDDPRYGRVLISWDVFERVDFNPGDSGPAYGDFPPGRPLKGTVTTRSGHHLAGRLVYDLDESETTETLDAPHQGINYTVPFGLIATIVPPGRKQQGAKSARVTLHSGEDLQFEPAGDLGDRNAGMLVFIDGRQRPEYVPWIDVKQIDFDRPPARYPANAQP